MQVNNAAQMYDTASLLAKLQIMSWAKYKDTGVQFIASFVEHVYQLNQHIDPKEHLSYTFLKSLLLLAVMSDKNLVDQLNTLHNTGSAVADIAALKLHILSKASLYDGKDSQAKLPTSRNEL